MKRSLIEFSFVRMLVVICTVYGGLSCTSNVAQAARFRRVCARPQMRCGLPPRDYQYRLESRTVSALSTIAVPLRKESVVQLEAEESPAGSQKLPKRKIKLFQLDKAELVVNQRKISRIAFQLDDHGMWTLSLRGDFHERGVARTTPYLDDHLKRCQFQVRVRCYANYPIEETASNLTSGKPVMLETCEIKFWVQSGEPYTLWKHGCCQKWYGKEYFDLIDRAEIDFCYYEGADATRPVSVTPGAE